MSCRHPGEAWSDATLRHSAEHKARVLLRGRSEDEIQLEIEREFRAMVLMYTYDRHDGTDYMISALTHRRRAFLDRAEKFRKRR